MGNYRNPYELYHWGIKGMKWGVRRYQNEYGSLTAAGRKRMYREHFDMEGKDPKERAKYVADANKWVGEDLDSSKKFIDANRQLSGDVKRLVDKSIKKAPREQLDLSNMTDQELRERINRAMLERQYNDVFNPPQISKGKEFAAELLETAGDVLAVAGSAILVAQGIRALRGGG